MKVSDEKSSLANHSEYDEMPYASASYQQSHPNRLGGMARLFGVEAALPSRARVLELGCADGSNILPMAEMAPSAHFLGIDGSRVQIEAGQRALAAAGVENVELRRQDIREFSESAGEFDYIIAHGVYSWVPEEVRAKLLAICERHLAANGVAYISYNALPGWNLRRSLRDMLLFHTQALPDATSKVQQARALLKFLADGISPNDNGYGTLLRNELKAIEESEISFFRHDLLGNENTPCYFHEFIAQAHQHGLQYLGEPSLAQMLATNFPPTVSKTLEQVSGNLIVQEQYMDFLRNRTFRQTLLCRQGVKLARNVGPDQVRGLAFQSLLVPLAGPIDLTDGANATFRLAGGQQLTVADAFLKAAFQILAENSGNILGYSKLLESARQKAQASRVMEAVQQEQVDDATLATNLTQLIGKGLVEVYAEPVQSSSTVPDRPMVGRLARYQAMNTRAITSRVHSHIATDIFGRHVIHACDGTRTQDELTDHLIELCKQGILQIAESGQPLVDELRIRELIQPRVRAMLVALTQGGMFVP